MILQQCSLQCDNELCKKIAHTLLLNGRPNVPQGWLTSDNMEYVGARGPPPFGAAYPHGGMVSVPHHFCSTTCKLEFGS